MEYFSSIAKMKQDKYCSTAAFTNKRNSPLQEVIGDEFSIFFPIKKNRDKFFFNRIFIEYMEKIKYIFIN